MTVQRAGTVAGLTVAGALVGWVLFVGLPRWTAPAAPVATPPAAEAPAPSPKIQARLFYVSASGARLQAVEREVDFGETPALQAHHLVEAQLTSAHAPLLSAIPQGTRLRNVYLGAGGIAYVDLTGDITSGHPGGSLAEILTVYSVVGVLTENLPAITSVQILIDGREVDTLAGHVDLRQPLERNPRWFQSADEPEPESAAVTASDDSEDNP